MSTWSSWPNTPSDIDVATEKSHSNRVRLSVGLDAPAAYLDPAEVHTLVGALAAALVEATSIYPEAS